MNKILLLIAFTFIAFNVSCKISPISSSNTDDDNIVWSDATHGVLTDTRDNKEYNVIIIGEKVWMAENLKVTQYRNGDKIPKTDYSLPTDTYCSHNNDDSNINTYGLLYNWYAIVDSRGLAPAGWHIPSDEEWKHLEMYLGMSQTEADYEGYRGTDEGRKLKSTSSWYNNGNGTNESGFTALPGGYRGAYDGTFSIMGGLAHFWSSTGIEKFPLTAWGRQLDSNDLRVARYPEHKRSCRSVRCVKD